MLNLGLQKVHPGEGWFQDMLKWHETTLYDSPNYGDPEDFIYIYINIYHIYTNLRVLYTSDSHSQATENGSLSKDADTHTQPFMALRAHTMFDPDSSLSFHVSNMPFQPIKEASCSCFQHVPPNLLEGNPPCFIDVLPSRKLKNIYIYIIK